MNPETWPPLIDEERFDIGDEAPADVLTTGPPDGLTPDDLTDMTVAVDFSAPEPVLDARHHAEAAAANEIGPTEAILAFRMHSRDRVVINTILLRAAAGAGKSMQLRRMVIDALSHPACVRVAVTAFMNRQVWPLAKQLADELGKTRVCLLASRAVFAEVPTMSGHAATVVARPRPYRQKLRSY